MVTRERIEIFLLLILWSLVPMWTALLTGNLLVLPTDLYPVFGLWATESWWGTWKNIWFSYPKVNLGLQALYSGVVDHSI